MRITRIIFREFLLPPRIQLSETLARQATFNRKSFLTNSLGQRPETQHNSGQLTRLGFRRISGCDILPYRAQVPAVCTRVDGPFSPHRCSGLPAVLLLNVSQMRNTIGHVVLANASSATDCMNPVAARRWQFQFCAIGLARYSLFGSWFDRFRPRSFQRQNVRKSDCLSQSENRTFQGLDLVAAAMLVAVRSKPAR